MWLNEGRINVTISAIIFFQVVDYPLELTHFEDISRVDRFTSFYEIQYFERFLDSIFLTSDTLPQRVSS